MRLINNAKIIDIMERTFNLVDPRMEGHGMRVAYRLFKAVQPLGLYDDERLRDICILGLLHDIGAYKTEDINGILDFDIKNTWNHSVYGYLFLKHFSPIKDLAPLILFHHADKSQMAALNDEQQKLVLLLQTADHMDIMHHIKKDSTSLESKDYLAMDEDIEFNRIFRNMAFTSKAVEDYVKMMVYFIDSRSPQTMLHTFAATHVAVSLARLAHVDEKHIESVATGAMLHDIGKMGTPLYILEGTVNPLSSSHMEIMKEHVVHSKDILQGCLTDQIFNIAVNHHEKLNGKGYPRGLDESSLHYLDKLMAVADIFSAMLVSRSYQPALSKEKAIQVLCGLGERRLLDPTIVKLAVTHYDDINKSLVIQSKPVIDAYKIIKEESDWIHNEIANGRFNLIR